MIYWIRSAKIPPNTKNWERVLRLMRFISEHYPEVSPELVRSLSGPVHTIRMKTKHESFAACEAWLEKVSSDEAWTEVTKFREGESVLDDPHDTYSRVVDLSAE